MQIHSIDSQNRHIEGGREGGREDQSRGSREKRGKGAKRPLRPPFAQKRLAERENASRITRWVLRVRLTSQFNQREGTGKEEVPAMAKTDPSNIANHAQADGPHGKKSPISESFGGLPCRFEAFRNALIRVTRSFSMRADTYRPTTFPRSVISCHAGGMPPSTRGQRISSPLAQRRPDIPDKGPSGAENPTSKPKPRKKDASQAERRPRGTTGRRIPPRPDRKPNAPSQRPQRAPRNARPAPKPRQHVNTPTALRVQRTNAHPATTIPEAQALADGHAASAPTRQRALRNQYVNAPPAPPPRPTCPPASTDCPLHASDSCTTIGGANAQAPAPARRAHSRPKEHA